MSSLIPFNKATDSWNRDLRLVFIYKQKHINSLYASAKTRIPCSSFESKLCVGESLDISSVEGNQ